MCWELRGSLFLPKFTCFCNLLDSNLFNLFVTDNPPITCGDNNGGCGHLDCYESLYNISCTYKDKFESEKSNQLARGNKGCYCISVIILLFYYVIILYDNVINIIIVTFSKFLLKWWRVQATLGLHIEMSIFLQLSRLTKISYHHRVSSIVSLSAQTPKWMDVASTIKKF